MRNRNPKVRINAILVVFAFLLSPLSGLAQETSGGFGEGSVLVGFDNRTCNAGIEGSIRYNSGIPAFECCNGTSWASCGGSTLPSCNDNEIIRMSSGSWNCSGDGSIVFSSANYVHYFLSSISYNGNLGGQSGANTKCEADPQAIIGLNYSAILGEVNWAIAGVQYAGTYGAGLPYSALYTTNSPSHWAVVSTENCNDWTSSSSSISGGECNFVSTETIGTKSACTSGSSAEDCDNPHPILCVGKIEIASTIPWAPPTNSLSYFLSNTAYNGNLGGQSGANAKCNADANAVSGKTYVAYLNNTNWAIAATDYYGTYGTGESFITDYTSGSPSYWVDLSGNSCSNWSSSSGSNGGGECNFSTSIQIGEHISCTSGSSAEDCDNPHPILCVEQP